jgi:hypothetical protein
MHIKSLAIPVSISLLVTACASVPSGPSVMVMPAPGQSFEQFRADDALCQQFATMQIGGGSASDAAVSSEVGSAVVGTLVGAALGAAVGGGQGAAVGAGSGLLAGSVMGLGASASSSGTTQQRYDNAYIQCMYTKGHQVPVSGSFPSTYYPAPKQTVAPAPRPAINNPPPPPPAGLPPPPPPQ